MMGNQIKRYCDLIGEKEKAFSNGYECVPTCTNKISAWDEVGVAVVLMEISSLEEYSVEDDVTRRRTFSLVIYICCESAVVCADQI